MNTIIANEIIALLINPLSGKGKAVQTGQWLSGQLTARSKAHISFFGNWPTVLDDFAEIWIVGGDGTMNYFLNHYKDNQLPIALFKGGTGNDLAWKLYGNCTVQQQLDLVLAATVKRIDAGICNDVFFINSCGIGFDGEVLRSIKTIRWLGGHIGYLAVVIRKIFSFKELHFNIEAGNVKYSQKFLLVIVNNSSRTGGGFMVTPTASISDGSLDMLLCRPLSIWKRLRYLPVIEKGSHMKLPFIFHSLQQKVIIEAPAETPAQLDGELVSAKIFNIQILPGKLLVKY